MKSSALSAFAVALLGGLAVAESAWAQPVLVPHRAVYELTLDPARTSSKIDRASGRIAFEITGNACEGYSVNLRQATRLDTGEGRASTSDLTSVSWEDGAAKSYRFMSKNVVNDEERNEVDGTADKVADGSLAIRLKVPKPETFPLTGKIAFPTEHLIKLLVAGAAGERIVETRVFDGAPDGKKVFDTLAVIGQPAKGEVSDEAAKKPELSSMPRYPVTVSYFEPGVGERTPTYVLGFELYENGVSRALRLNYGGFALRGELSTLEFLKATPCKR